MGAWHSKRKFHRLTRVVVGAAVLCLSLCASINARAQASEPLPDAPRALLVESETQGIDPIVGRFVTEVLAARIAERGYEVVDPEAARQIMLSAGIAYPPQPADLWRMMADARAARAVHATVWAAEGRYALRIAVASADGRGPYYGEGFADQVQLGAAATKALDDTLPAPNEVREVPAKQEQLLTRSELGERYFATLEPPPPPLPRHRPLRVVLQGGTAFGITADGFRNHNAGGRLDFRPSPETAVGIHVSYQSLKGRVRRVASLLSYAQFEHRVWLDGRGTFQVPLRLALGYLVRNGPFARLATGLGVNLGKRVDLVAEVVAPTLWMTSEQLLFSLDVGIELGVKL